MVEIENLILAGNADGMNHTLYDVTPVFSDAEAFAESSEFIYQMFERELFDTIVTVDTAGTVFASSVASRMGKSLIVVSSKKHPCGKYVSETIETVHGNKTFNMPEGAISKGKNAILIVDSLTYGKDVSAAVSLLKAQGYTVSKIGTFFEDKVFNARRKLLRGIPVDCMFTSEDL